MSRVLIIRQYIAEDVRVQREIRALTHAGHEVDLLCVRSSGEPRVERRGAVTIRRVRFPEHRSGALLYVLRYGLFLLLSTVLAAALHLRRRYDLVQVNTLPDTLVFAAAFPKLLGVPVLLDLHETMPEFFATKFGRPPGSGVVRVVAAAEQASIRFADEALTCTEQMRDAFVGRGANPNKIHIVLNASDEELFDPGHAAERHDGFTVICHGTMEDRYGLDTLVRAAALLRDDLSDLRVRIYGDGPYRARLLELVAELGVGDIVWVADGFVPADELVGAIAGAQVGVVAMKRDAFRDLTHCNKMFDYISMRLPAAVSRTTSVEAYFDGDSFGWFTSDDPQDLARVLRELHEDPERRERLARHAAEVAEPYRWPHQERIYLGVAERLMAHR